MLWVLIKLPQTNQNICFLISPLTFFLLILIRIASGISNEYPQICNSNDCPQNMVSETMLMCTHNICNSKENPQIMLFETILMSIHSMFLWRNKKSIYLGIVLG